MKLHEISPHADFISKYSTIVEFVNGSNNILNPSRCIHSSTHKASHVHDLSTHLQIPLISTELAKNRSVTKPHLRSLVTETNSDDFPLRYRVQHRVRHLPEQESATPEIDSEYLAIETTLYCQTIKHESNTTAHTLRKRIQFYQFLPRLSWLMLRPEFSWRRSCGASPDNETIPPHCAHLPDFHSTDHAHSNERASWQLHTCTTQCRHSFYVVSL